MVSRNLIEKIISIIAISLCAYLFYATTFGPYKTTMVHRAIFLAMMLIIFFGSSKPLGQGRWAFGVDWFIIALSTFSLEIPDDVFERVNKTRENTFLQVDIPAKSYKGQTEKVKTCAFGNVLFTRDDVPEEAIYYLTKAFWGNLPEVQKDLSFKIMKKEYALIMTGVPLHPGAQRYFKEVGILK